MARRPKIVGSRLALIFIFLTLFLYAVRDILLPFVLAAAVAYVMSPVLGWLQRVGMKRWAAAALVYGLILAALAGLGWWLVASIRSTISSFHGNVPQELHKALADLLGGETATVLGIQLNATEISNDILALIQKFFRAPAQVSQAAAISLAVCFGAILTLVLLFYFLLYGPFLGNGMLMLVPPEHRPRVRAFAKEAHPILFHYFYGVAVVVAFTALVTWVGVGPVFHLPHPVFLALATGFLELIPVAGPVVSTALLGGSAVLHGGTAWTFVWFALFCLGLRLSIDQILGPIVLGQAMVLSPVTIIFAFFAGGVLFGAVGVFLAIPTAAALKIAIDRYYSVPTEDF